MNPLARPAALLLIFTFLTSPLLAQKRQTPAKPSPKPAAAPAPAPTFDNLLPAEGYVIYAEVRDVGQLIHSGTFNDLLEPVLKLAGPPKEFKSIVKWVKAHADEVMSSRLLLATWNVNKTIPDTIVAIEFASPEEATKFTTPLNEFLPTVLPNPISEPLTKNAPPKPNFHLERLGSLVVITQRPWTMKQLRPAGSKPLADTPNFRTARNRFSTEPIFTFVDFKLMTKEEEERRKQYEAERQRAVEEAKHNPDSGPTKLELTEEEKAVAEEDLTGLETVVTAKPPEETPTPDPLTSALSSLGNSFFNGENHIPEAAAFALSYEGESFDLHGLLISAPGEKVDAVPFWPNVIPGAPIAPEAPNIFPADTELFATMSLDLPQIVAVMSKPPKPGLIISKGEPSFVPKPKIDSPFKALEKQLNISIESDLLPLLGSEIAISLPMNGLNVFGLPQPPAPRPEKKGDTPEQTANAHAPIVAIAVRDQERLRALMPKLVEGLGFKGASQFATTERREDTELVSYANLFSYAFVGNFIVFSSDAATTRYVVDSYLKQQTLASESAFRMYTRWQPRQLHGELYISPTLMEGYQKLTTQTTTRMSDQARNFLASLSMTTALPITYSLSNEGLGPLHELHVPKALVAMIVTTISGEMNPPALLQNERMAIGMMYGIAYAEEQYKAKKGAGSYGTLEDLIAANMVSKEGLERSGYKFEVTAGGDKFEASAVPVEYGKSGTLSLFIDHTRQLRGGDRNGAAATASDPPLSNY